MPDLTHSLLKQDIGHLRIVAEFWGLELEAIEVDQAREELSASLLDFELLAELMDSLSPQPSSAAERGLPIYAECGGLMFLGEAIVVGGATYRMVGLFPLVFAMRERPQAHGYTIAEVEEANPFYPAGTLLHGHEFHYSEVTSIGERTGIAMAFSMRRGLGIVDKKDGICYKNVLGAYTHVHALGTRRWVDGMISKAREYREHHETRHA